MAYTLRERRRRRGPARPATIAPAAATGRRKEAVARVRIVPGTGVWTVNGRTLDSYFPNKLHQQVVNEPFAALELEGRFDVIARIHGGGITGQAGALRLGVARCPQRDRRRGQPAHAEEGRPADPRRPRDRAQEGRSEEGPQGSAVQQALIRRRRSRMRDSSAPTGSAGSPTVRLTAELALDLAVAAARVLVDARRLHRAPSAGRGRSRPPDLRAVPRARRGRRPGLGRRRRAPAAGAADPGRGLPDRRPRRRPRRGDLRLAQPDARQRHQVPRPRRPEARRRARGREIEARLGEDWDRPTGADVGRVTPYARSVEEYVAHLVAHPRPTPLAGLKGRPRLRQRRGAPWSGPHALRAAPAPR